LHPSILLAETPTTSAAAFIPKGETLWNAFTEAQKRARNFELLRDRAGNIRPCPHCSSLLHLADYCPSRLLRWDECAVKCRKRMALFHFVTSKVFTVLKPVQRYQTQSFEAWKLLEDKRSKVEASLCEKAFVDFCKKNDFKFSAWPEIKTGIYSQMANHVKDFIVLGFPLWIIQRIIVGFLLDIPKPLSSQNRHECVRKDPKSDKRRLVYYQQYAKPDIESGKYLVVPKHFPWALSEYFDITQSAGKHRFIFHGSYINQFCSHATFSLTTPSELLQIPPLSITQTADMTSAFTHLALHLLHSVTFV